VVDQDVEGAACLGCHGFDAGFDGVFREDVERSVSISTFLKWLSFSRLRLVAKTKRPHLLKS
jgi:hypothetical protein